ncbi:MAG: chorismate mutase [Apilactobacillus sp.]|uniref:Chorismate mutase n=1 Tax=Apilactobacillus nanyangensis TaxID=2799579 RepID=A0ABT0HYK1_9LACO|nr:chorismate mutase [Apilactobacillus nanyangensis]MCK8612003.1 chorismate mutase [Apilactobacillus nanyangensis]MCT6858845.1 chorismate mutase [Apilactobacillus sp.]TMT02340.1 chorismate mutase [Apilactobacillus kunkeei]TMT04076.1 chorismate mutase [Apilactobacillus kunkeei]
MELNEIRKDITKIDTEIIELLKQRFTLCQQVGEIKRANNLPILDEKREQEILAEIELMTPKFAEEIKAVFKEIMQQAKNIE